MAKRRHRSREKKGAQREQLGSRARQVLDLLYRRRALTAGDLLEEVSDLPSYSAARGVLRVLEEKGLAGHRREGARYVYFPIESPQRARRSALGHLVDTLFDGSALAALQALVEVSGAQLSDRDREELRSLIERAEERTPDDGGGEE